MTDRLAWITALEARPRKWCVVDDRTPVTEEASMIARWWTDVGEAVDDRWSTYGRSEESFADVAAGVLADRPAPLKDIVGPALAWLAEAELAHQHDLGSGFGQPAVTVFDGSGFIVDLLFWFDETIAIHDHRFNGAFTIVEGASLQNVYEFDACEQQSPGIEIGELQCTRVERLSPGQVRVIPPGSGLIHSNVHFGYPAPTMSLVVRSQVRPEHPQRFYSHSGLSFISRGRPPDTIMRLQGFSAAWRVSPETGIDYLRRALSDAPPDLVITYLHLAAASDSFHNCPSFEPLIEASSLGTSHRSRRSALQYMHEVQRSSRALLELRRLDDPDDRLLMSMVAGGTEWDMAAGVLRQALSGASLHRSLGRLLFRAEERSKLARRSAHSTPTDPDDRGRRTVSSDVHDSAAFSPTGNVDAETLYESLVTMTTSL